MAVPDSPDPLRTNAPTNGGSRPVPDPTELTDKAIAKAVSSLTQYIEGKVEVLETRIDGIDKATTLRIDGMKGISPEIDTKVDHLQELHNEKFTSIATQFKERDTRSERESRDNKVAVDAAFAAQKEAAAKQDEANAKAIDKSEKATAETIKTNQELSRSTTDSLTKSLDEVKIAVSRIESQKVGATETRQTNTENRGALYATIGLIITIVLFGMALLTFIVSQSRVVT